MLCNWCTSSCCKLGRSLQDTGGLHCNSAVCGRVGVTLGLQIVACLVQGTCGQVANVARYA
jgi:hypothetical protein